MSPPKHYVIALLILVVLAVAACAGTEGPAGPQGEQGPPGPQGAAGPPGEAAASELDYVGSETCGECHEDLYNTFRMSGHPYKLNAVENGQPPEYPFSQLDGPPEGYTWEDISYVIGGYGWKARFIDLNGYIITGDDENATTQYNLYNDELEMGDNWVGYHAGEVEKPYDCGTCHTTGYSAWPPDSHQDDLPGLIGTWAAPGIQCEACHGPGSEHVSNPDILLPVERDSELCGECHRRGDPAEIDVSGAFVKHHEQYEDFFQSQHRALDCVDCHNPHASTRYQEEAMAQGSPAGIETQCVNCHWEQAQFFKADHRFPSCEDCHMANLSKSALGNEQTLQGDIPSHLFAINPFATEQFYEGDDGNTYSHGYITVQYACTQCHNSDGIGRELNVEQMMDFAQNYHARPAPVSDEVPEDADPPVDADE